MRGAKNLQSERLHELRGLEDLVLVDVTLSDEVRSGTKAVTEGGVHNRRSKLV